MNKKYRLLICAAFALMAFAANANAQTIIFSNDFEDGNFDPEVGTWDFTATSTATSVVDVVTSATPNMNGDNVGLFDFAVLEADRAAIDLTLNLTDTALLSEGNTVTIDFDVAARRTNGTARTIFVDALDSNGAIVTRLVLGDLNAFPSAAGARQRPGYDPGSTADSVPFGASTGTVAADSTNPGSFWYGADTNSSNGFTHFSDSAFSLTIGASDFAFSTTRTTSTDTYSTTGIANFDGGTFADIASFEISTAGLIAGFYLDNLSVSATATAISEPGSLGDFNGDQIVNCDDLDGYVGNIGAAVTAALAPLDLDNDGFITATDANEHITTLVQTSNGQVGTFPGDLNCDGQVNVLGDAFALVANLGNTVTSYSQGDINFDGTVNVLGDAFSLVGNLGNSNNP